MSDFESIRELEIERRRVIDNQKVRRKKLLTTWICANKWDNNGSDSGTSSSANTDIDSFSTSSVASSSSPSPTQTFTSYNLQKESSTAHNAINQQNSVYNAVPGKTY